MKSWRMILSVAVALGFGCATGRVYTEADAPMARDPRVERMVAPDFLRAGSGVANANLAALKWDFLPSERRVFVPVQLSEKQTLVTADDLREIAAAVGRMRPHVQSWVIRQVWMDRPEDGLWVLLEPNVGVQFYLLDGKWEMAGRYYITR